MLVGADDPVRPQKIPFFRNFLRIRNFFRADRGVRPYEPPGNVRNPGGYSILHIERSQMVDGFAANGGR